MNEFEEQPINSDDYIRNLLEATADLTIIHNDIILKMDEQIQSLTDSFEENLKILHELSKNQPKFVIKKIDSSGK